MAKVVYYTCFRTIKRPRLFSAFSLFSRTDLTWSVPLLRTSFFCFGWFPESPGRRQESAFRVGGDHRLWFGALLRIRFGCGHSGNLRPRKPIRSATGRCAWRRSTCAESPPRCGPCVRCDFSYGFSNKKLRYELLGPICKAVGRFRYRTRRS